VGLGFAGIETTSNPIDASSMSSVHLDIWSSNITEFRLKIVDFGMDGALGGGDDSEHELKFDAMSTPALANGAWYSIDVPFTAFTGLTGRSSIQQLIIGMDPSGGTVYLDNLYFYDDHSAPPPPPPPPPPTIPTVSAPTPTEAAAEVISIFSDAYMNVTVDTFATSWSAPSPVVSNIVIGTNNDLLKRYSGLGYAGLETTSTPVDATTMTHVHLDFWSTNISEFRLKIVDFGMDGAPGGGDDSEHEIAINANSMPAIGNSSWYSIDLPLSSFTGLTGRSSLQQYVIGMNPTGGTVFIDNFYFYR